MTEDWRRAGIDDAWRRTVAGSNDVRGSFRELWRASATTLLGAVPMVQANLSDSRRGTLRGLHFHLRQWDLWTVIEGRAHVALVDLRSMLDGRLDSVGHRFGEVFEAGDSVLIPPGVAHGFFALEPVRLLYLVSSEYDASDEHGFAWNDERAGIAWPSGEPLLSERDATAPTLDEAISAVRQCAQRTER